MRGKSFLVALLGAKSILEVNAQEGATTTITVVVVPSEPSGTRTTLISPQYSTNSNPRMETSDSLFAPKTVATASSLPPWERPGRPTETAPRAQPSVSTQPSVPSRSSSRTSSRVTLLGPTARVEGGVIVGSTVSFPKPAVKVNQFLGVPFANPAQRFSPPNTPVRSWVGRWDATKTRASCMQQFNVGPAREFTTSVFNVPAPVESEDCLYLNIFTPREQPRAGGRPVLFWIYGGSLQFGNAGMPGYNGSYLAGLQDVIVITANYRTNLFGFPTSPAIPIRERNLGFLDQRAALEWVRNNIEEFGGNPSKVTIFGESAGAASVDALLTSYSKTSLSRPNFRAAILQSGQIGIRRASAQATPFSSWDKLAAEAKCSGTSVAVLACLRKAPAIALKAIIESNSLSFTPTVDNYTLVSAAERKRATGQLQTFPVMVGSNAEEGRVFQINQNNLTDYLQKTFPNDQALQQQVRAAYPKGQNGLDSDYDIASAIMTDLQFGCTAAILAADNVRGVYPTWRFFFNATFPNLQKFPNAGAYHASEIELIFGTYGTLPTAVSARASTTEEVALSAAMQKAWAQFAKNPAAGPGWTKYGTADADLASLGGPAAPGGISMLRPSAVDSKCGLYASLY